MVFDAEWKWQLKQMDEYRFLLRFPPQKKIDDLVITSKGVTYFYLDKKEVMVSLKAWDGEIEHVGELQEIWVQVRGVPPKWSDFETIQQLASTLGMLVDIDWKVLFTTYFEVARIKVVVKDPYKIPKQRIMELDKKLYLISLKTEDFSQPDEQGGTDDKFYDLDDGEDPGVQDSKPGAFQMNKKAQKDKENKDPQFQADGGGQYSGGKSLKMWSDLFKEIQLEGFQGEANRGRNSEPNERAGADSVR